MNLNCRTSILRKRKSNHNKNYKCLGLTVSNRRCKEVKRRMKTGWMSGKKVSGVPCDRKLSARVKGKMYKSVV